MQRRSEIEESEENDTGRRISKAFDKIVINNTTATRHIMLDIWKFYIALVSLFSSLLGMYMAAFMISVGTSEFLV